MNALPIGVNLLLFAVGAGIIWWAGTRLERLTDAIARRTGLGGAFSGLVLLAVATSLPEVATTVTALLLGNVELAVHNLLGGVAFQVVVLTIADAVRRGPLTRFAPSFGLLIGGVGVIALLGIAIGGLALGGDAQFAAALGPVTVGLNPVLLMLPIGYAGVLWLTRRAEGDPRWRPVRPTPDGQAEPAQDLDGDSEAGLLKLGFGFAGMALLVLVAG